MELEPDLDLTLIPALNYFGTLSPPPRLSGEEDTEAWRMWHAHILGEGAGGTYDCKSVRFTESDRISTARQLC